MKMLIIDSCNQCRYWDERFMICNHPKVVERYTDDREGAGIPAVCPLEDASQQKDSADDKGVAVLERVHYLVNNIDCDTISLIRR